MSAARRRRSFTGRPSLDRADELLTKTKAQLEDEIRFGLQMGLTPLMTIEARRRLAAAQRALDTHALLRRRAEGVAQNNAGVVAACDRAIQLLRTAPLTPIALSAIRLTNADPEDREGEARKRIGNILEEIIAGDVTDPRIALYQLESLFPKVSTEIDHSMGGASPDDVFAQLVAAMGHPAPDTDEVASLARALAESLGIDLEASS